MRERSQYVGIFWVALGIFVSVYAYVKLGLGKFNNPGLGLMPFLLGIVFGLVAFWRFILTLLGQADSDKKLQEEKEKNVDQGKAVYRKVILVLIGLFAYAFLLESLGFLLTTFFTMTLLFRSAGFKRWVIAAVYSGIVVLITYFLFTYLGVRFPPGILRLLGLN